MRRAPALPRAARLRAPVTLPQAATARGCGAGRDAPPAAVRVLTCTSLWDPHVCVVSLYVPLYRRQIVSLQQDMSCGCHVIAEPRAKRPAVIPCVLLLSHQAAVWGRGGSPMYPRAAPHHLPPAPHPMPGPTRGCWQCAGLLQSPNHNAATQKRPHS